MPLASPSSLILPVKWNVFGVPGPWSKLMVMSISDPLKPPVPVPDIASAPRFAVGREIGRPTT